ncbi:hypothetical protein AB0C02_32205 [Micromonospora sp. NPDC048999]|uniref:hypothetical protein n=1 Tax=Micromonospora sp. NPDC048999 TaxID=3155391 RepID=UPI0033DA096D
MSWASSRGELPERSTIVRGCPASAVPVVTQLVTQPRKAVHLYRSFAAAGPEAGPHHPSPPRQLTT